VKALKLWHYVKSSVAQVTSLAKIFRGNDTGFYELQEDIKWGSGMLPVTHIAGRILLWVGQNNTAYLKSFRELADLDGKAI
jgi:hypothetical protein